MAGFDDFLSTLQGAGQTFMVGLSRGLQSDPETAAMGNAMSAGTEPLEANIRRGIKAKDKEQARKEYDLDAKQEYQTAVDINQRQAEGFAPMADEMTGIRSGLAKPPVSADVFGFTTSLPNLNQTTAAGRVSNIGRAP